DEAVKPEVLSPAQRHGDVTKVPLFPNVYRRIQAEHQIVNRLVSDVDKLLALKTKVEAIQTQIRELATGHDDLRQRMNQIEVQPQSSMNHEQSTRDNDVHELFGLSPQDWATIPVEVKNGIEDYRTAKIAGYSWLFVVLVLCVYCWAHFVVS